MSDRQPTPFPNDHGREDQRRHYSLRPECWSNARTPSGREPRFYAMVPRSQPDFVRRAIEFLRPSSICREMWAMAGDTSMLWHGNGPPAARRDSRFTIVSRSPTHDGLRSGKATTTLPDRRPPRNQRRCHRWPLPVGQTCLQPRHGPLAV
jgi:hypothetical protein